MRADPDAAAREADQQQEQKSPTTTATANQRSPMQRRVTELPVFTPTPPPSRQQPRGGNDGVFANLAAKPERGDSGDEKPPVRLLKSSLTQFLPSDISITQLILTIKS